MTRSVVLPQGGAYLVFLGAACLNALGQRQSLDTQAASDGNPLHAWDVIFSATFSYHFTVYAVIPVVLIWAVLRSEVLTDSATVLRMGSFSAWGYLALRQCLRVSATLMVCMAVAAGAAAFGLSFSGLWNPPNDVPPDWPTPIVWFVLVVGVTGYVALLAWLVMVAALSLRGAWLVSFAAALMVAVVVSFAVAEGLPLLDLSAGLLPRSAMAQYGLGPLSVAVPLILPMLMGVGWLLRLDARARGVSLRDRHGLVITLVVVGLVGLRIGTGPAGSLREAFEGAFYGVGQAGVSLWPYVFTSLISAAPAYAATLALEDDYATLQESLLRHTSTFGWWLRGLWRRCQLVPPYVLGVGALAVALAWVRSPSAGSWTLYGVTDARVAWQFLVNGSLQIVVYVEAVHLARWVIGRPWAGAAVLGIVIPGGFFWGHLPGIPVAQNALGLLEMAHPLSLTAILGGWLALLVGAGSAASSFHRLRERNLQ